MCLLEFGVTSREFGDISEFGVHLWATVPLAIANCKENRYVICVTKVLPIFI